MKQLNKGKTIAVGGKNKEKNKEKKIGKIADHKNNN